MNNKYTQKDLNQAKIEQVCYCVCGDYITRKIIIMYEIRYFVLSISRYIERLYLTYEF